MPPFAKRWRLTRSSIFSVFLLVTTCQRSDGKVMFSVVSVCSSVMGDGSPSYRPPFLVPSPHPHRGGPPTGHVQTCLLRSTYGRQAGGRYPTGMHSCWQIVCSFKSKCAVKRKRACFYHAQCRSVLCKYDNTPWQQWTHLSPWQLLQHPSNHSRSLLSLRALVHPDRARWMVSVTSLGVQTKTGHGGWSVSLVWGYRPRQGTVDGQCH